MSFAARTILLLCLILLLSIPAAAQGSVGLVITGNDGVPAGQGFTCSMTFGPLAGTGVAGVTAPYSAVGESSSLQTLADGTHIIRNATTEKVYRDSQGRTRTERPLCRRSMDDPDAVYVEIRDPVAGYAYLLDVQEHTAHRYVLQVHEQPTRASRAVLAAVLTAGPPPLLPDSVMRVEPPPPPPASPDGAAPKSSSEPLGSETMEGVLVQGTRTTRIIPVGEVGNDRSLTVVHEVWTSPELKILILSKTVDPRIGEQTIRLTNVDTSEPSLSLFEPPADYKVVDETEAVQITYRKP